MNFKNENMSISDIPLCYSQNMDNKLQDFINKEDCYFIHYASNGFYNGSSPAPKISCIVIYNLKNDKGYRFNIRNCEWQKILQKLKKQKIKV